MANSDMYADLKVKRLTHKATLHARIVLTRQFRLRLWLGVRLIRLAAWVLGCGVVVVTEVELA